MRACVWWKSDSQWKFQQKARSAIYYRPCLVKQRYCTTTVGTQKIILITQSIWKRKKIFSLHVIIRCTKNSLHVIDEWFFIYYCPQFFVLVPSVHALSCLSLIFFQSLLSNPLYSFDTLEKFGSTEFFFSAQIWLLKFWSVRKNEGKGRKNERKYEIRNEREQKGLYVILFIINSARV